MDTLGTEVSQKMRCAVKAKLLELGSGGSSNYIDDELPDYVMIMVANKRSKQQMIDDLNLFLGSHTSVFVNWLHQVLQKLQEVTLPANAVQQPKRKAENSSTELIPAKKDKKEKKKDRKLKRGTKTKPSETAVTTTPPSTSTNSLLNFEVSSITDVFADQLIQKANKTMAETPSLKKEEPMDVTSTVITTSKPDDGFDIPTISEIAQIAAGAVVRRKELTELEELQKKINLAKRQLRAMGSEESEDEDFLNIKADGEEFDDKDNENNEKEKNRKKITGRNPSPIVFNKLSLAEAQSSPENKVPVLFRGHEKSPENTRKRSIMERLGARHGKRSENIISLSAHRRVEKEIYVPIFKRKELEKIKEKTIIRDEKKEEKKEEIKSSKIDVRQRIGSRVFVAPPKPEYKEEEIDVPVNSIVKVKPRPIVPISKQANKNLLLRAVAEAQKSIASVRSKTANIKYKSSLKTDVHSSKLNRKTYERDTRSKIIIEIPSQQIKLPGNSTDDENDLKMSEDEESSDEELPIKQSSPKRMISRTQFVVTLDGMYQPTEKKNLDKSALDKIVIKNKIKNEVIKREEVSPKQKENLMPKIKTKSLKNVNELNKLLEKNLAESEKTPSPVKITVNSSASERKRSKVSPIKFDISQKSHTDDEEMEEKEQMTVTINKKVEPVKKYDNIPPLLSAVTLPLESSNKSKSLERCKFFPTCRLGEGCEFAHPSNCKSFPNCKFGEKCMYGHPKCKFDLTCTRPDCNFYHTPVISSAPPLASHVVPVQNYKSISAVPLPAMCKFYPNCANNLCAYFHPKICRFGKNCLNKVECNFFHHELQNMNKHKWISPSTV